MISTYVFIYICKKIKLHLLMFKIKGILLFFLMLASLNILVDRCLGCEKAISQKQIKTLHQANFSPANFSLAILYKKASLIKKKIPTLFDSSFSTTLSEDNTESKPFIHIDFAISNCIPEFKEDYHKLKFGLDDRNFHILMKHTTSSICMLSFNNLNEENYLTFVVPIDNIILFRRLQV